jgi:hypothetical protein
MSTLTGGWKAAGLAIWAATLSFQDPSEWEAATGSGIREAERR